MNVLLVEDDEFVRSAIAEMLREEDMAVVDVSRAEDALLISDRPDVLVTDVSLGSGANGLVLASAARHRWPSVGLIYISGDGTNVAGQVEQGADLLLKPFRGPLLVAAIRKQAARQANVSLPA